MPVGDTTGDDQINAADISYMMPDFFKTATARPYADINKDGNINGLDISAMRPNFLTVGSTRPGARRVQPSGAPPQISSAQPSFVLSPSQAVVRTGDIFTMTLAVDLHTAIGDTIDVNLDLDPRYLELVDAAGNPASTLTLSPALASHATYNQVSSVGDAQRADLSITRFSAPFLSGYVPIGTLRLRAKAAVAQTGVLIVQQGPRMSDVAYGGRALHASPTLGAVTVSALTPSYSAYLPATMR